MAPENGPEVVYVDPRIPSQRGAPEVHFWKYNREIHPAPSVGTIAFPIQTGHENHI